MDDRPLVSVVVPAFNARNTLVRTLQSVSAQTYRNIEIIIVDDGSTDDTAAIAKNFCAQDKRAKLISQENGWVARARNAGIAAATGEWIAPLDSDDLWHPEKIESQVEAALRAPDLPGFVYCWFHLIDEEDWVIGSSEAYSARGQVIDQMLYFNFVGNGSSILINRAALNVVGLFETGLKSAGGCEDLDMQLRLARNFPVELSPRFLIGYRVVGGSMSDDRGRMQRSWRRVLELFEERGGKINRKAVRWNTAYRALRMAEEYSRRGEARQALRQIAHALRLDPMRSSAKLAYRLARSLRVKIVGRRTAHAPIRYFDAPTDRPVQSDPDAIDSMAALLARWDRHRMARFESSGSR